VPATWSAANPTAPLSRGATSTLVLAISISLTWMLPMVFTLKTSVGPGIALDFTYLSGTSTSFWSSSRVCIPISASARHFSSINGT
ncbi:hypothetical protein B0H14DRAFT_2882963, partial [Mycena olivaceomarginata]